MKEYLVHDTMLATFGGIVLPELRRVSGALGEACQHALVNASAVWGAGLLAGASWEGVLDSCKRDLAFKDKLDLI